MKVSGSISSYAERTIHGAQSNQLVETQQGRDAIKEMQVHVKEDEESIEETVDKALKKRNNL